MANGFQLSSDNITYVETPVVEPKVEFTWAQEELMRGDQQILEVGGPHLRWYFADEPISGTVMRWFQAWVTGASQIMWLQTKTGEVDAAGDPVFRKYSAVMGRPTGKIETIDGGGQLFVDVEIKFWNLVTA